MNKTIAIFTLSFFVYAFSGCGNKDEQENKTNMQYLIDKEKELNDREAKIRLKEIELEEREKKLNLIEQGSDTSQTDTKTDTSKTSENKTDENDKKEVGKDITTKFENPTVTVKDYYEYIKRAIYESGNFDANMKKAQKYFPSRSVDKLKNNYRKTKEFVVIEEPKLVSQKENRATVVTKIKQVEIVKVSGKDTEVTKTLSVTYNLTANEKGEWVISSNLVKAE